MATKTKNRSETQNFKNKTNPQGEVPCEDIRDHLESKIIDQVKQLAKGFSVSIYSVMELGKELIAIENEIEKENEKKNPKKEEIKKDDF